MFDPAAAVFSAPVRLNRSVPEADRDIEREAGIRKFDIVGTSVIDLAFGNLHLYTRYLLSWCWSGARP